MYIEDRGEIFHTFYSIKYQYTHSLKGEINSALLRFDNSLNVFAPTSIISKVNDNTPVALDSFFTNVFARSQQISDVSGGLFDITVSPLINAWGFGFKNINNLTPEKIDSLRSLVGYKKIKLKNGKIEKENKNVQINASAIAKGYACDVIGNLLEQNGVENYMVEIGGEVRMKGINRKGHCWRIGINKPIDDLSDMTNEIQEVVSICDGAMATSGNYRNYRVKDGKKYGHTIDPRTGSPTQGSLLSVTIIADDCMTADAYATAFMVLGKEKAEKVAAELDERFEYYMIYVDDDGYYAIAMSEGMTQYISE